MENKDHISYKEYEKKVNKAPNEGIAIFVSAFFILLLLFLGIAKQISPDVDVSLGENENTQSETIGVEKNSVDERLKLLQMEDKNEMFAKELEEKVVVPENKDDKKEETVKIVENEANPKPEETASPEPKVVQKVEKTIQQSPQQTIPQQVKVVVGYYSTREQAEVAKGIIAESGLNISPFVRNIGGAYTIQVGSYSTREKAQNAVDDLLRNNYPARIIME